MLIEIKKKVVNVIIFVLIMAFLALSASALNNGILLDSSLKTSEKMSIAQDEKLERYTWFNGDREEVVSSALDEVGIFVKKDSKINNIQEIVQSYDSQATLIKDYDYVTLLSVPRQSNYNIMEEKNSKFKSQTGNNANPVFYGGQKKDQSPMVLTGEIIVHFRQDWDENKITNWANDIGIEIVEKFSFSPNTYLFRAGSGLRSLELANQIYLSGDVIYAYPNWWKVMKTRSIPNDSLFSNQWHLLNTGQAGGIAGEDVNITSVWDTYKGSENEVIAIVDDGLEILHPDLAPNILPGYSWDYVHNDSDPTDGEHGTSCAGVAAARGNNGIGVTGAAPEAKLVGYNFLNATTEDVEYEALTKNNQIVDIYSNSWGPASILQVPVPSTLNALAYGTTSGRGGKGNIYVWAGGNGNNASELYADNSNYDGYANSRYVMAIAASDNSGKHSSYSEEGANILINAPSNGGTLGITTTDRTGFAGYDSGDYTSTFGGTSSSAPLVSGIIALMLQANPNITWRDVRLILARTAKKNNPLDSDWTTNGAGYHINHKYGFGRIDAYAAVSAAASWKNVGHEISAEAYRSPNLPIPDDNPTGVSDTITIEQNISIEFVEINFTSNHPYNSDFEIELTAPSGTKSILAKKHVGSNKSYNNWRFGSVRQLGEFSKGTWKLTVKDIWSGDTGTFQKWGLRIYGSNITGSDEPPGIPEITGSTPLSPVNDTAGSARTFSVTSNQTVSVTWYINGTQVQFNGTVSSASYTNTSAANGTWIVNATATNANGTVSKEWTWFVNPMATPITPSNNTPSLTGLPQESQINDSIGANRTFNITANQTVNVTWYINSTQVQFNGTVSSASYTNNSAANGTWIVNATATNANGTVSIEWVWIVNPSSSPLIITITSPDNNSYNGTGNVNVTVKLSKTGTALLNWNGANESMDGAGTNLYKDKTGLLSGKYNFMIFANDSAGNRNISETRTITVNRTTTIPLDIDTSTFVLNNSINISSPGGNVTVTIPNGTNASLNGSYLPWISIDSLAEVNSTFNKLGGNEKVIGEILYLGHEGAIFRPDIQIRFNYTHSQLEAAGVGEPDMAIKYYNISASTWENLVIFERNTTGNYLIVNASHFSTFALVGTVPTTPNNGGSGGGGSSGGGGGGGGGSGENYNNILLIEKYDLEISKDALTSYRFADQKNPIMFVNITGNTSLGIITTSVEVLKDTSGLVNVSPGGLVYKNANIWVGTAGFATPKNIKEAVVRFRVENSWLSDNNFVGSDVKLFRWTKNEWIKLETAEITKDNTYTYFEGKTNMFSPFVISSLKEAQSQVPSETRNTATEQKTASSSETAIKKPSTKATEKSFNWILLVFGALVLAGIIKAISLNKK